MRGRHIWLIGASEGIGAALAGQLAEEGAILALSARNQEKLQQLKQTLPGENHLVLPLDVTDIKSMEAAWEELERSWAVVDIVLYNAGSYEPMSAKHFELSSVETMIDVNLRGAFRMLSVVLPYFIKRNAGHIGLVGSVAGYRGLPAAIGYGASKSALIHLAENLQVDLHDTGIVIQVFNPGFVKTRLTDKNNFPMPSLLTPEEAASYMIKGLKNGQFEVHFPQRFSFVLKALSLLPGFLYFWIIKHFARP